MNLKDSKYHEECFIIANGPSINRQNLLQLKEKNVIAMSGFYNHIHCRDIAPAYYVVTKITQHFSYATEQQHILNLREMDHALPDNTLMFLCKDDEEFFEINHLFTAKKKVFITYTDWCGQEIKEISLDSFPDIGYVSESALQIALYLGFKNIYLLGFDHDDFFRGGEYFDTKKVMKHYDQKTLKEKGLDAEILMRHTAYTFSKYKMLYSIKRNIYNANGNSTYVDVFPKVSYEQVLSLKDNELFDYLETARNQHKEIPWRENCDIQEFQKSIESLNARIYHMQQSILRNRGIEFTKKVSLLTQQIEQCKQTNLRYIVYGFGTIGKMVFDLLKDQVVLCIDQNENLIDYKHVFPLEVLSTTDFDCIIITCLDREQSIQDNLSTHYGVNSFLTFSL